MVWDPNLWTVPLLLAGVLTSTLAWAGWKYRSFPGLSVLSQFLVFVSIWILAYLGEILATSSSMMVWLARVQYIGIVMIGPTWLGFALAYTGRSSLITRRRVRWMLAIPIITLLLAWTTQWHGAIWQSFDIRMTAAGTVLDPSYGAWFWVNMAFQYGCLSTATFLLLWGIARESSPMRGRGIALGLGTLAPWLGNVLYVTEWEAAAGIDLGVYGAAMAGVIFGWGILARSLIEIIPVAREKVVEISEDAVLVVGRDDRIVDANPAARRILGNGTPLLRAKTADALGHLNLDSHAINLGRRTLEFQVGNPPRSRIFDCQVSELGERKETSPGRVVALRDITETELHRRALEEGREALEAQLRQSQKLEMVGTMAGGIAHDFNNILAAIRGYAELAALDLPEESGIKDDLEQILQGADRARHLVRQILTFSRQAPEDRKNINLNEVLEDGVGFLRASLPASISLKTTLDPELPLVFADSSQIHQVFMNLCSNAADAMEGGQAGHLEVILKSEIPEFGRLPDHLGAEPGKKWVRLTVQDDGAGMDEATRSKVFEPFYTTKEVGRGTGLGMSVVHGIVIGIGGWVEVASRVGVGTEITVWLPSAEGSEPSPVEGIQNQTQPVRKEAGRVLVVDDEEALLRLTRRFLEGMGIEARVAKTVGEAQEVMEADPDWADLILTDHKMPGGTGLGLVAWLRSEGSEIPTVLMTGFGDSLPHTDLKAVGIDTLLSKPFTREELGSALFPLLPVGGFKEQGSTTHHKEPAISFRK